LAPAQARSATTPSPPAAVSSHNSNIQTSRTATGRARFLSAVLRAAAAKACVLAHTGSAPTTTARWHAHDACPARCRRPSTRCVCATTHCSHTNCNLTPHTHTHAHTCTHTHARTHAGLVRLWLLPKGRAGCASSSAVSCSHGAGAFHTTQLQLLANTQECRRLKRLESSTQ
jgi:hypothetical protein